METPADALGGEFRNSRGRSRNAHEVATGRARLRSAPRPCHPGPGMPGGLPARPRRRSLGVRRRRHDRRVRGGLRSRSTSRLRQIAVLAGAAPGLRRLCGLRRRGLLERVAQRSSRGLRPLRRLRPSPRALLVPPPLGDLADPRLRPKTLPRPADKRLRALRDPGCGLLHRRPAGDTMRRRGSDRNVGVVQAARRLRRDRTVRPLPIGPHAGRSLPSHPIAPARNARRCSDAASSPG